MCRPASFVVTRDRVFWSKRSDSHEDIIREFNLYADGVRGANIVRVEIVPPSGDLFVSTDRWELSVDQNDVPDWFDRKRCEEQVRLALVDWVSAKLVTEGSRNIADGECYACGSSTVTACGSSRVTAYDSSTVTACGSSRVTACDNSTVTAYDSSTVMACGSSSVTAYGSSSVTAYGSSTVMACGSSRVTAYDSSTVTACGSSRVTACDNSTVTACEYWATVRHQSTTDPVLPVGPHAVVIDSRGKKSVAVVGE
jgi:hypothetical protein